MNPKIKRLVIWWAGWGFIVLGVIGLVLPILQGIVFLLIGLSLLSNTSPWAAKLLSRIKERFPKINKSFEEAKVKARDFQVRLFRKKEKRTGDAEP